MVSKDRKRIQVASQQEQTSTASAPASARTAPQARADGGRNEAEQDCGKDAPPTNRASNNCNDGGVRRPDDQIAVPYFQLLRFGVDSLYLSYPGELYPEVLDRLKALKALAQSSEADEASGAQYPVQGHVFEVKDKGARLFPFILEDGHFRIQLAKPSKTVPMAFVKVSSGYLAQAAPVEAERALRAILSEFGDITDVAKVSRIDLFCDFVTSENIEWERQDWVTRAATVDTFSVGGRFSGWMIGKGAIISARLYDKVLEIQKSRKEYLFGLWHKIGWNPGHPVWRLEFELKRELLVQHGLSSLDQVLNHQNGLWSYGTTEWLRLAIPNPDDQTRARWPVHPLWGYLSSVDWEGNGGPLLRKFDPQRIPDNKKLFNLALSNIIAFMAREGIADFEEGREAFHAALQQYHEDKAYGIGLPFSGYIAEKVAFKARQFNSLINKPEFEAERKAREQNIAARNYRKASDGE